MGGTLPTGSFYGGVARSIRVPGATLAETRYEPGFEVPVHDHAQPFFVFALRGSFDEEFERDRWRGGPATVFYHPAGAVHREVFGERGGHLFNVQFDASWFDRHRDLADAPPQRQIVSHGGRLGWLAGSLFQRYRRWGSEAALDADELLREMMDLVTGRAVADATGPRPPWLDIVLERLAAPVAGPESMADLAVDVGVHPCHLSRAFRRHVGCSPGDFRRRQRIERACGLLTRTDRALADVAVTTGFTDQAHFTRHFKRELGVTPGAYRAMTRA